MSTLFYLCLFQTISYEAVHIIMMNWLVLCFSQLKRLKLRKNNWDSETYEFDEVLTEFASQKRVYEGVAKPVVEVGIVCLFHAIISSQIFINAVLFYVNMIGSFLFLGWHARCTICCMKFLDCSFYFHELKKLFLSF